MGSNPRRVVSVSRRKSNDDVLADAQRLADPHRESRRNDVPAICRGGRNSRIGFSLLRTRMTLPAATTGCMLRDTRDITCRIRRPALARGLTSTQMRGTASPLRLVAMSVVLLAWASAYRRSTDSCEDGAFEGDVVLCLETGQDCSARRRLNAQSGAIDGLNKFDEPGRGLARDSARTH